MSGVDRRRVEQVEDALRALSETARALVDAHPHGHLLRGRERLALQVELPLDQDPAAIQHQAHDAHGALQDAVDALLAHAAAFRPGRLLCLRCGSAECEHAGAPGPRQVFVGYGPSGLPRFSDLASFLVERRHEQVERLFDGSSTVLSSVIAEQELSGELLPAFRDAVLQYRIHGQIVAGFWRIPDRSGRPEPLAVTIQIVSTSVAQRRQPPRRRFGVNLIARGPYDEPLEHLHERLGTIPWMVSVRWVQTALGEIEATDRRRAIPETALARRIDGLLHAMARRFGRDERARGRRTRHATERHAAGDRPTRTAQADLAVAPDERIVYDTRRHTLVVLGERGRTHVFSLQGKLVTSLRYPPATVARRLETGLWRAATMAEISPLRDLARSSEG